MNEIIVQYKKSKEWCKLMRLIMIVPAVLGVLLAVLGFTYMNSPMLFTILGIVLALPGIVLYIIAMRTFNKFDKTLRELLKKDGKTDAEISAMLECNK